ncbi:hypothetical protein G6F62_004193 [Rhizopus arrhizus]|nr:hypothetical protein G6F62_004193 [Rhizopus arrhizus]
MSGSATPANSNVQHNSLLRTRKSDRDLETVDRSEIIEMGEEEWMPNLKENKRRWTPYSQKHYILLIAIMFLLLCYQFTTKKTMPVIKNNLYYNGTTYYDSTVIFISLDGFRNDYLQRKVTPNIDLIGKQGIHAEYMNPSFPSITFPNHWTLATGLYPESHGIVSNEFYDPLFQEEFIHKYPNISAHPKWWGGEPIWVTSKKQGKKSAVIMWPGSNVETFSPDYYVPYTRATTAQDKMNIALNWLDLPLELRPQSISIYIPQIDQKGHGGGPDGKQLNSVLMNVDNAIGYLMEGLKERNLDSHVHLVLVSDHGMAAFDTSRLIFYDHILSAESESYLRPREAWPLLGLRPREDAPDYILDQIYNELEQYTQSHPNPHFQFYRREEIPARFHYNSTERIAPIVIIPDVGYAIIRSTDKSPPKGIHGYDNIAVEMRAIFASRGPKIDQIYKRGSLLKPFYNVEVYQFLTNLLDLQPASNNATLNGQFDVK